MRSTGKGSQEEDDYEDDDFGSKKDAPSSNFSNTKLEIELYSPYLSFLSPRSPNPNHFPNPSSASFASLLPRAPFPSPAPPSHSPSKLPPDGKLLLFLSAISSVDSGAHSATDSLHKINWPADGLPCSTSKVVDVKWRASQEHRLSVPEPKGAWPVFGHLHLLGGSTPPQIILGAMADEYGPLFTIRLGVYPTLVLSSAELAKEFFTIHDMAASGRPKMAAVEHIGYNYAMFGFAQSGPYWREMRKIATLELLSNRRVQLLKGIRVSEVATFLKELYTTWSASTTGDVDDHNHGVLVELKQWFGDLTLNVILSMVAGKRYSFDGGGADEDEKREADCVQDAVRKFFYFAGVFVVGDVVPYLRWLDIGGHEKAMKKTAKEIDAILGEWLQEHKQRRRAGETGEHDFMDAMLTVLENADLEGYDADTVNKATCLNMILGGSDTTMVTLTWAISLLLNNRHVLKQAQDELDTKVGRDRIVSESDTGELVYLNAIVKETLRLYPVVPLSAQHEFTEDCIVNGYHVEKGTRLITNLWKIQTNPRVWPDPLEFKPERFLTTHKNVDLRGNHFDLIPFGSGRRACPGSSFALQMVQFTLASFLHAFEISTPSDALVDMSESFGLTNVKATPLEVLIKPRSRTKLYL